MGFLLSAGVVTGDGVRFRPVKILARDFPGGPVVKTPHSHFRGPGFDPWSGN